LKRRYVLAFFQKLRPCWMGIEACASSHHWSRELAALGHTVWLMMVLHRTRHLFIRQQDQQFGGRLRIAECLVQSLREAGYVCELAEAAA